MPEHNLLAVANRLIGTSGKRAGLLARGNDRPVIFAGSPRGTSSGKPACRIAFLVNGRVSSGRASRCTSVRQLFWLAAQSTGGAEIHSRLSRHEVAGAASGRVRTRQARRHQRVQHLGDPTAAPGRVPAVEGDVDFIHVRRGRKRGEKVADQPDLLQTVGWPGWYLFNVTGERSVDPLKRSRWP